MTYADTDFFLAIIKEEDWLKSKARRLLEQHQGRLWTSVATVVEMLLLADRLRLDPERVVVDTAQIVEVRGVDMQQLAVAAHYMKKYDLRALDALHAAFCGQDSIISSDRAFERVGLRRIPLEE